MSFGPFILVSLFYAVIGVRVVAQVVRERRTVFDRRFTQHDRSLVDQAAFFLLVPISVALHEAGHAIMVRVFGAEVTGFGFYLFAGFVSFRGELSNVEHILIALAGPLVSVLLAAAAIAVVFLKRSPFRAAYNEMLLQFGLISGLNALVVYPLLDFATGLQGGDWSQIYDGGVPALSAVVFVVHAALLALIWWGWKSVGVMRRVNALTGVPAGAERGALGGLRPARPGLLSQPGAAGTVVAPPTPEQRLLAEAGARVAAGWTAPVRHAVRVGADDTVLTLIWQTEGQVRGVLTRAQADGSIEVFGATPVLPAPGSTQVPLTARQRLTRFDHRPTADDLTLALRLAMEEVARWQPVAA